MAQHPDGEATPDQTVDDRVRWIGEIGAFISTLEWSPWLDTLGVSASELGPNLSVGALAFVAMTDTEAIDLADLLYNAALTSRDLRAEAEVAAKVNALGLEGGG